MRFTSTPRGARLARRLVAHRLDTWGHPYTSAANEALTLITAELAANAVQHGLVPGRDFHLRLAALVLPHRHLRVEVTDACTAGWPQPHPQPQGEAQPSTAHGVDEAGRGLLLLGMLADEWGVTNRRGAPGKTVWAQLTAE